MEARGSARATQAEHGRDAEIGQALSPVDSLAGGADGALVARELEVELELHRAEVERVERAEHAAQADCVLATAAWDALVARQLEVEHSELGAAEGLRAAQAEGAPGPAVAPEEVGVQRAELEEVGARRAALEVEAHVRLELEALLGASQSSGGQHHDLL